MTAVSTFRLYASDTQRTLDTISQRPRISRDVEYYKENISNIKSLEDFMGDSRIFSFTMKAYGLEDMIYARAFIEKIIEGGTEDTKSLANQLTDPRYKELASDFDFHRYGSATTSFSRVTEDVVDKFYHQAIEVEAGNQSTGARLALYFQRKVENVEKTISLLADPAFLEVTQVALGLPASMSATTIDKQVAMIEERLDVEDLKDPEFLAKFMERFTILYDLNNPESIAIPSIVPLSSNSYQTISYDLLASIQNLKLNV